MRNRSRASTFNFFSRPAITVAMSNIIAEQYRGMASRARLDADAASLVNVKQAHYRSAERFDEIAQAIESVAKAKARNDAAKAAEWERERG
jgi:hypothetical protein